MKESRSWPSGRSDAEAVEIGLLPLGFDLGRGLCRVFSRLRQLRLVRGASSPQDGNLGSERGAEERCRGFGPVFQGRFDARKKVGVRLEGKNARVRAAALAA